MAQFNRSVAGLAAVLAGAVALQAGCSSTQTSLSSSAVVTKNQQDAMTPDSVLADLKAGNKRFVAGKTRGYNLLGQVKATAGGQYPKAIVLSCLDSRVPPEMVFDQGIGDIFVGRVAGNFENVDMLGSMEFGTAAAGSKLIVVLGHGACGAVKGAIDNVELGNLTATLANIDVNTAGVSGDRSSKNTALVDAVIENNVRQTVRDITGRSEVLAGLVAKGKLKVVGGVYNMETGEVAWLN
jgi:carbonic anhydrase